MRGPQSRKRQKEKKNELPRRAKELHEHAVLLSITTSPCASTGMARKKSSNPLAQARGQQKAPENVWFRRSGAGYRLFVEFYANQPLGVVVPSDAPLTKLKVCEAPNKNAAATAPGMSRAAKRRRKQSKNGKEDSTETVQDLLSTVPLSAPPAPAASAIHDLTASSPQLFQASKNVSAHLLPFFQAMTRPLPTTFRIRRTAMDTHRQELIQLLNKEFPDIVAPTKIQPKNSSSTTTIFQSCIPKHQLPKKFKDVLVEYSQNGTIARQELGSMLPVLALSPQPGDCVVDMCASPGSKTLQAIEAVVGSSKRQRGLVLANDVLESRLEALREAVQRAGIPESYTSRIRYSQVDATKLSLSAPCQVVICDVPCSGDGTCRKDPHILPMWKPQAGNALHATQLGILQRSLQLVQVGGVVCYSTCSLNPVEDEAVVAAALSHFGDAVEIMEITSLEGWIHRPGVTSWRVAHYKDNGTDRPSQSAQFAPSDDTHDDEEGTRNDDNDQDDEMPTLTWYASYEAAKKDQMMEAVPTMWPSLDMPSNLHYCARLFPQDYDSGGFFLALLKKCKEF